MRGLLGNRRLIERAGQKAMIQTSDLATAGRLHPQQADRFIDYVIDVSVLFKEGIRVVRMRADRADLDKLAVGTRIIRKATEGVAPTDLMGITATKRQLAVTEIILPVDVTFSFFEDNIEREDFEDHLMRVMATQLSNDLEDLSIVGLGTGADPFLSIEKGWNQILKDAADLRYDTNAVDDFRNVVFKDMLALLPAKFKANKTNLRFYVSTTDEEKYRYQLGQRQTAGGDSALLEGRRVAYDGIPVVPVPYMVNGEHLLAIPDNLVFGIRRDVSLGMFKNERKRVWEYTWTLRVDYEIVETQATVIAYNF